MDFFSQPPSANYARKIKHAKANEGMGLTHSLAPTNVAREICIVFSLQ